LLSASTLSQRHTAHPPTAHPPTHTPTQQVQEAKSSRTQRVEGTVIAMAGTGSGKTMVVRRIFQVCLRGVGYG